MSIQSLRRTASCRFLITFLALAIWPGVAAAQGASAEPAPQNARMKRYGGGWECDRGYQRVQRSCVVVDVPPNAYLKMEVRSRVPKGRAILRGHCGT
jgi:hypothetical protein